MSELSRRESAAVWLLAIPIWGGVFVLLYAHQFQVVEAVKSPLSLIVLALQIWYHRFARRDLRRWTAQPHA